MESRIKEGEQTLKNINAIFFGKKEKEIEGMIPMDLQFKTVQFVAFEAIGLIQIFTEDTLYFFNSCCNRYLKVKRAECFEVVMNQIREMEIDDYISKSPKHFKIKDEIIEILKLWRVIKEDSRDQATFDRLDFSFQATFDRLDFSFQATFDRLDFSFQALEKLEEVLQDREDEDSHISRLVWKIASALKTLQPKAEAIGINAGKDFILEYLSNRLEMLFNKDLEVAIKEKLLAIMETPLAEFNEWHAFKFEAFNIILTRDFYQFDRTNLLNVETVSQTILMKADQIKLNVLNSELKTLSKAKKVFLNGYLHSLELSDPKAKEDFFSKFKTIRRDMYRSSVINTLNNDFGQRWKVIRNFLDNDFKKEGSSCVFSADWYRLLSLFEEIVAFEYDERVKGGFAEHIISAIENLRNNITKTRDQIPLEKSFNATLSEVGFTVLDNFMDFVDESWRKFSTKSQYYAPIVSMAQSSGAGKSKLGYELLRRRPGFYVNFNLASPNAYPFRSEWATAFEEAISGSELQVLRSYAPGSGSLAKESREGVFLIFLNAVVLAYFEALDHYIKSISEKEAIQIAIAVLSNTFHQRSDWGPRISSKFKAQLSAVSQNHTLADAAENIRNSLANGMQKCSFGKQPFVLVFDEATNLLLKSVEMTSFYDIVRHAFHSLGTETQLILVSVATNSNVFDLNRPPREDSLRMKRRKDGLPPFILSGNWDAFTPNFFQDVQVSSKTLTDGSLVKYLISMGRPMWSTIPIENLVSTATEKIFNSHNDDMIPHLAMWAIRTGLGLCPFSQVKRRLIKSHMASLVYVTPDLTDLAVDYPSEPVLAIAARTHLKDTNNFVETFGMLHSSVKNLYVDRGRLAECIVAQLILQAIATGAPSFAMKTDTLAFADGKKTFLLDALKDNNFDVEGVPDDSITRCPSSFYRVCTVRDFLKEFFSEMGLNMARLEKLVVISGQYQKWSILDGIVNATHFVHLNRASSRKLFNLADDEPAEEDSALPSPALEKKNQRPFRRVINQVSKILLETKAKVGRPKKREPNEEAVDAAAAKELSDTSTTKNVISKELLRGGLLRQCAFLMPSNYPAIDLIVPVCFSPPAASASEMNSVYTFIPIQVKLPSKSVDSRQLDIQEHYCKFNELGKAEKTILTKSQISISLSLGSPHTWKAEPDLPSQEKDVEVTSEGNVVLLELRTGLEKFKAHPVFSRVVPVIKDILVFSPNDFTLFSVHEKSKKNARTFTKFLLKQFSFKYFKDDNYIRTQDKRGPIKISLDSERIRPEPVRRLDAIQRYVNEFRQNASKSFITWGPSNQTYMEAEKEDLDNYKGSS